MPTSIRVLAIFIFTLAIGLYFYTTAPLRLVEWGQDVTSIRRIVYSSRFVLVLLFLDFALYGLRKYDIGVKLYERWTNFLLNHPNLHRWLLIALFVFIVLALCSNSLFASLMGFRLISLLILVLIFVFYGFVDLLVFTGTQHEALIKKEDFLRQFITKAMDDQRVETQLWDFKKTLDMWHTHEPKAKLEKTIKFCELVAGFANKNGGLIIVGVTEPPRKTANVDDLENKLKHTREALDRYIEPRTDFVHLQQLMIKNDEGENANCLVLRIAQTNEVIAVKDEQGRYSHPKRLATGLGRDSYENIYKSKKNVPADNYGFSREIEQFVNDKKGH